MRSLICNVDTIEWNMNGVVLVYLLPFVWLSYYCLSFILQMKISTNGDIILKVLAVSFLNFKD